jgi:hypothetical protein
MNLLQQTFQPLAKSEQEQRFDTRFASDDDSSLQVSIFLGSNEGRTGILEDVTQVLRAYGFTDFRRIEQAPGSFFCSIEVRFGKDDRSTARRSRKQLQKDLLSDEPAADLPKRRAVRRLKKSLWGRARKKMIAIVLFGGTFLGSLTGEIFKDEVKGEVEGWLKDNGPKIARKADVIAAKELSPSVANGFHKAVKNYIDRSPDKIELKPPPSK